MLLLLILLVSFYNIDSILVISIFEIKVIKEKVSQKAVTKGQLKKINDRDIY